MLPQPKKKNRTGERLPSKKKIAAELEKDIYH
jgi:hypothetical protein